MKSRSPRGSKARSHSLLVGLGIGIAVAMPAHASTPNSTCNPAPAVSSNSQLSDEEVLRRITILRQIGGDSLQGNLRPFLGPNQLESSCFGQMTGGGGCTYSQESGCAYTQNCGGGAGGGKGTLQS